MLSEHFATQKRLFISRRLQSGLKSKYALKMLLQSKAATSIKREMMMSKQDAVFEKVKAAISAMTVDEYKALHARVVEQEEMQLVGTDFKMNVVVKPRKTVARINLYGSLFESAAFVG